MVDLHVHDAHFIQMLFGVPRSVRATGWTKDGVAKFAQAMYFFQDSKIAVSASCGVIDQAGRPFTHGFELYLEQATLQFEFSATVDSPETMPMKVPACDGRVERPTWANGDDVTAFLDEVEDMSASIGEGKIRPRLDGTLARNAIHVCHCIQNSVLQGREIPVG